MPSIHGILSVSGVGTSNYEDLTNLPQINDVTLIGNKTLAEIGIPDSVQYDADNEEFTQSGVVIAQYVTNSDIDNLFE